MMMDRIYRQSAHLFIWLGVEVARPVDLLVNMANGKEYLVERQSIVADVASSSPWFRRRWVIQEAALPRTCVLEHLG